MKQKYHIAVYTDTGAVEIRTVYRVPFEMSDYNKQTYQ